MQYTITTTTEQDKLVDYYSTREGLTKQKFIEKLINTEFASYQIGFEKIKFDEFQKAPDETTKAEVETIVNTKLQAEINSKNEERVVLEEKPII